MPKGEGKFGGKGLLVAERINQFITKAAPDQFCDDCIVDALALNTRAHSSQVTAALGTTAQFKRRNEICRVCKNERMVIRYEQLMECRQAQPSRLESVFMDTGVETTSVLTIRAAFAALSPQSKAIGSFFVAIAVLSLVVSGWAALRSF